MYAREEICVVFATVVCNVCIFILRSTKFKVMGAYMSNQPMLNERYQKFYQITREQKRHM